MGKNYINAKTFLEKRFSDDVVIEDAIHTALLTLKESFDGQITENNIEVGIATVKDGFRLLSTSEIKDYLKSIV